MRDAGWGQEGREEGELGEMGEQGRRSTKPVPSTSSDLSVHQFQHLISSLYHFSFYDEQMGSDR